MAVTIQQWDDPTSWNAFVSSTPDAHFQQSWEWGDLAPDLGGTAIRLAALDGDEMVGAAQVFVNPISRLGLTYMSVPRGPALPSPSIRLLGPLIDRMRMIGLQGQALGVRVEANAPACNPDWKRSLTALGLYPVYPPSQPRSSWLLDIDRPADELLANMKQKTRYNVRLAAKKGVKVREGSPADVDAFYALYRETAGRDDFFIQPREFYSRMFSLFWASDNFRLLLAEYEGELIAAVTLLRFGRTCWYVHGASSNAHRNVMAPYLLQWESIQAAQQWGCSVYDFRAIPDVLREDQDMYGVYRFKEGFGGYQYTTLETYTTPFRPLRFGLWQLYFSGRFALMQQRRQRAGLPARQFA